MHQPNLRI